MFDCQTSFCYFTVCLKSWESQWNLSELSSISALSLNQKLAIKSAGQDSEKGDALTTHCAATKYCTGSQRLVFPWNLWLSSRTSCVKLVHNKISCVCVSCAAYKYGLITLQCAGGTDVTVASLYHAEVRIDGSQTVYTVCIHLCYDHSQLDPFANLSLAVHIAEPLRHVEPMLFTPGFFRDCTHKQINNKWRCMSTSNLWWSGPAVMGSKQTLMIVYVECFKHVTHKVMFDLVENNVAEKLMWLVWLHYLKFLPCKQQKCQRCKCTFSRWSSPPKERCVT